MASSTVSVVAFLLACAVMGATSFKVPEDHKCAALNEDIERIKICFPEDFPECDETEESQKKAMQAYSELTEKEQQELQSCIKQSTGCVDENDKFDSESCVANINENLPEDVQEEIAANLPACDYEGDENAKLACAKDVYDEACGFPKPQGGSNAESA